MAGRRPLPVALLGFGNVGRAFGRFLQTKTSRAAPPVRIAAVADRSGGVHLDAGLELDDLLERKSAGESIREIAARPHALADAREFVASLPSAGVPVLVECLPTAIADGQPGLDLIELALNRGCHVVTVDKGPLVHGYARLLAASRDSAALRHSGATGVRPPEGLSPREVTAIHGVLNGTTNHILSSMLERRLSFAAALDEAKAAGIAEPEPSMDLEGWDTACKILILAAAHMGTRGELAQVRRRGIGPETEALVMEARASGRAVRLIARAVRTGDRCVWTVAPEIVAADSPFFGVRGTAKAALFERAGGKPLLARGVSGRHAIAQTILDDIASLPL